MMVMGLLKMTRQYWRIGYILLHVLFICISPTIGDRYYYPDKPYIDISNETDQPCPNGCELCTDLRFICHQLNISSIPQNWPVTLQYLELTHLPMKRPFPLHNAPFKRYSRLRYLDISYNTLTMIRNNSFDGLYHLEYLKKTDTHGYYLYPNYYGHISPGTFSSLKRLKYLDLQYNVRMGLDHALLRLRDLPQDTSLDYVDLSYTNNADIHHDILSYALRASRLVVFERLKVKVLKLDGNRISAIDGTFGGYLQSIEYLSLRRNYLIQFTRGIQWTNILFMYNMKVLDIGRNAQLPVSVEKKHDEQQQCIPLPMKLEKLYVDNFQVNEKFKFYDKGVCFNVHNSFHFLDMTGATLMGSGGPLTGLESLRYVSLQSAKLIITNSEAFNCKYWPNIQTMLLGNIDLRPTFGGTDKDSLIFQNCSTLVSLDLENTKLSGIPKQTFKDMNQVQFINISGNGINKLDVDLKNNRNLTLLNASSNFITHLTSSMMSQLEMIAAQPNHTLIVDIQNNPLLCDCGQIEFIQWIKRTKVMLHNFDDYSCFSGDDSYNIKTLVISELELRCKMKMITITTVATCVVLFIFLVSLAIYAKRYRLEYLLLVSKQFAKRAIRTKKQADDYRKFRYHGFLSYSSLDDFSVIIQIQKKMEEEFGLRLAIHDRDFIPGKYIIENITNFVEVSRKVVIIMSNNYLESRWCNFEFELSRNKRLDATYDAMVMIMLHDKDDLNKAKISSSLKSYLGQKTYLPWPKNSSQKPTFWLKLKEALDFGDIEPQLQQDIRNDLPEALYENDEGTVGGAEDGDSDVELVNLDDAQEQSNGKAIQIEVDVHDDTQPLISL
ncbi:unnamed protein product [Owenia fusiformis]|uniref:TIR domain-containing protein n=1 Tax=Owenia fusiformis TaxID=6347 RepID=A0A8S4P8P6_OWEFU|nr:unnamed protein product [Owenia fusiformis]